MQKDKELNASSKLTFLLVGGGIGAILALLFAPKPGTEFRQDIADAARKGADQTRQTALQVKEQATNYYGTARDQATEYYQTAKDKAQEITSTARDKAQELTATARDKAQELKVKVQELPAKARQTATDTVAPAQAALEAGKNAYDEKAKQTAA